MIDAYVSWPHYLTHIAPFMLALPEERRGKVYLGLNYNEYAWVANALGLTPARGTPPAVNEPLFISGGIDLVRAEGRPVVFVDHGAGQTYERPDGEADNAGYAGGRGRDQVRLFLAANEGIARKNLARYPATETVIVGDPTIRLDPHIESGDPVVAFSFHFDLNLVPETQWTFPYWKDALIGLNASFDVLGHAHPKAQYAILPWYRENRITCTDDFEVVREVASVLVVDNSSAGPEFARTGRPIVWLNAPQYRRSVHHGSRFWEWESWAVTCDRPNDLPAAIQDALDDPPERRAAREAATRVIYPYVGDEAAQRGAAAILAMWS